MTVTADINNGDCASDVFNRTQKMFRNIFSGRFGPICPLSGLHSHGAYSYLNHFVPTTYP